MVNYRKIYNPLDCFISLVKMILAIILYWVILLVVLIIYSYLHIYHLQKVSYQEQLEKPLVEQIYASRNETIDYPSLNKLHNKT